MYILFIFLPALIAANLKLFSPLENEALKHKPFNIIANMYTYIPYVAKQLFCAIFNEIPAIKKYKRHGTLSFESLARFIISALHLSYAVYLYIPLC